MLKVSIVVPSWHYWVNPCRIQALYEMYFATIIESRFSKDEVKVDIFKSFNERSLSSSKKALINKTRRPK